jgi:hypothetical protein
VATVRTVTVSDPLARANVIDALSGAGAPAGVEAVDADGETVAIAFDERRTAPELIDALIAIETAFVPAHGRVASDANAIAVAAARGLGDPQLDGARIIETYLPEPGA